MSSKTAADRTQRQLLELLHEPGNQECADCRASNPRWASWDHGVFLCVQCAGLHRKMGTHITRVKSLTLDVWSKEQVAHMRARGNTKSNALLNPDPNTNPPPSSLDSNERESALERYIRAKYEYKEFMRPSTPQATPAPPPPPAFAPTSTPARTGTTPDVSAVDRPTVNPPPPSSSPSPTTLSVPNSMSRPRSSTGPPPVVRVSTPPGPSLAGGRTTPSPDHASKRVRFRSESLSIPYLDDDKPLTRTPSPARDRKAPAKGILRARRGLSNGNEYGGASSISALSVSNVNGTTTNRFGSSFFSYMPPDEDDDEDDDPPTTAFPIAQRLVPMHTGSAIAYNSQRGPGVNGYGQSNGAAFQMPPLQHSLSNQMTGNTNPFGQMWNPHQQQQHQQSYPQQQPQRQQPQQQPQQQQAYNPFNGSSTYPSPFRHGPQPSQQSTSYTQTQVAPSQGSIWDDLGMLGSVGSNNIGPTNNVNGYHPQPPPQAPPSSNPFTFQPSLTVQTGSNTSNTFPTSQPTTPATLTPLRPQLTGFIPSSDFGKQLLVEGSAKPNISQASTPTTFQPTFLSTPTSSFCPPSPAGGPSVAPLRPQLTGFVPSSKFGLELAQENSQKLGGSGSSPSGGFNPSNGNGNINGHGLQPPQPHFAAYNNGNGGGSGPPSPAPMVSPGHASTVQGFSISSTSSPFQHFSMSVNGKGNSSNSNGQTYSTTNPQDPYTMTSLQTALPTPTYQQHQQQSPQNSQQYLHPNSGFNPFFAQQQQQPLGMGGLTPQRTGTNPFLMMNGQYSQQQQQQQQQASSMTNGRQWR